MDRRHKDTMMLDIDCYKPDDERGSLLTYVGVAKRIRQNTTSRL